MINENSVPGYDFELLDEKSGSTVSFRYLYSKSNKSEGIRKFRPIILKVNMKNRPRQIRCACNNMYVTRQMTKIDQKSHVYSEKVAKEDVDNYNPLCDPSSIEVENRMIHWYDAFSEKSVLSIDRQMVELIIAENFDNTTEFCVDSFINLYRKNTFNVYELLEDIFKPRVLLYLYEKLPSLMIQSADKSIFELAELLYEIDSAREDLFFIRRFEVILNLAPQIIANINNFDSDDFNGVSDKKEFQLFNYYNSGMGYCIPLAVTEESEIQKKVPMSTLSMYCYFPYYLWSKYIDEIIVLSSGLNKELPDIFRDLNVLIIEKLHEKI